MVQLGEQRDTLARVMSQTEDGAQETQAILTNGQGMHRVMRVDSAHRDCSSLLIFYTN